MFFVQGMTIKWPIRPHGNSLLAKGDSFRPFFSKTKVQILKKNFCVEGVKIQWLKTLREFFAGRGGLVLTYFLPNKKVKIFKKMFSVEGVKR